MSSYCLSRLRRSPGIDGVVVLPSEGPERCVQPAYRAAVLDPERSRRCRAIEGRKPFLSYKVMPCLLCGLENLPGFW